MNTRVFLLLKVAWVVFIACSFTLLVGLTIKSSRQIAKETASSFFKEIVTTRAWNAGHGGVYVYVDEETQPNPDLDVPHRDIYTTDSSHLTLINPAFMTRQISELAEENNEILYHITSLKPIRLKNKADLWETTALEEFEDGVTEVFEQTDFRDGKYYRYMAPLMVKEACMTCHSKQGYEVGQVRGGISVSIDAQPIISKNTREISVLTFAHVLFLIFGLFGITFAKRVISKQFRLTKLRSLQLANHRKKLSLANEELTELNHQKEKFLSIIAHDLKNPVGAMMGLSEVLVEEIDSSNIEHIKILIQQLHKSAVNTFELMDNLLTWSRSQQGKMDYNPEDILLKELIDDSVELVNQMAQNKQISLLISFQASKKLKVFADRNMVYTILRNLLTNSIKFTPENGQIEIISKLLDAQEIEIAIIDSGIGMSRDKIDNLFQIEKSASTPGTNNEKGTGLGLILVKEFVEKQNGKIQVNSQVDKGTTITFTLPLSQ